MYTNLDWTAAIGMIEQLMRLVGWRPETEIGIVRTETSPRGRHPGGCSGLKHQQQTARFSITCSELLHLVQTVCRYGLFVARTAYGSFVVETLSSILMGTQL